MVKSGYSMKRNCATSKHKTTLAIKKKAASVEAAFFLIRLVSILHRDHCNRQLYHF